MSIIIYNQSYFSRYSFEWQVRCIHYKTVLWVAFFKESTTWPIKGPTFDAILGHPCLVDQTLYSRMESKPKKRIFQAKRANDLRGDSLFFKNTTHFDNPKFLCYEILFGRSTRNFFERFVNQSTLNSGAGQKKSPKFPSEKKWRLIFFGSLPVTLKGLSFVGESEKIIYSRLSIYSN